MPYSIPTSSTEEQVLVYKSVGDKQIHLTFLPPTCPKFDRAPVYFIIPGGGWHTASKEAMIGFSKKSSDVLRARGWAVVSIDYRVCPSDGVVMGGVISDAMDAGRYLAHFADQLGIDPHRIVTSGHSAGGHLAMMMALAPHAGFAEDSPFDMRADEFTVVATAPLSPPIILYADAAGYAPHALNDLKDLFDLFPDPQVAIKERHRASPINYVTPLSVPTLLICGTHDNLVFAENSTSHYRRARSVGAPCEILYSYYGGHCFEPMVEGKISTPDFSQVQDALVDFVIRFE